MEVSKKSACIKLVLMDVDGVLTDGRLYNVPGSGRQHGGDQGFRFAGWHRVDVAGEVRHRHRASSADACRPPPPSALSSANSNTFIRVIPRRFRSLTRSCKSAGVTPEEVAFIGDDFTDVVLFRRVGLAIATANARPEVKKVRPHGYERSRRQRRCS